MKDLSSAQHFVGCDVSKDTLDFALFEPGKNYRTFQHIQVANTEEGFRAMRKWLRSFGVKVSDAVIGLEHTGSYSSALGEWCHKKSIVFVLLHPMDVKNACSTGRNKTDKVDAQFIADYLYTMREKLAPSQPDPQPIKTLRALRNERQLAVKARTAYLNQMKNVEDKSTLRRMEKVAATFTAQIKAIEADIHKVITSDEKIRNTYERLLSIPGIGMLNAITTIITTCNFTRFQTARQYAKFSCVCPLSRFSGSSVKGGAHVSHAGHSEIKSLLTEGARGAVRCDRQLRDYYQRKRAEGKSHGCVMNAVKFKLICRMFAVVKRQSDYVNTEAYRS